ncbi:sulfotransferase family protein [Thioalbus denitrificans]|uniref:Sulfotransferase domain-containing protein n=1 Tax=Thioalbus denitrificans TaxID=547122 RepID=A0A369C8K0_9GAMM|nr:sulfotransferase [Thioalbus denitrificans]RCX30352.1 sulfotransferase domain-containing protein [Thioalbus denitrificans]
MFPNFILVGAAKSGTSSLYHYLRQHPEVFMSREKEPHFFAPAKWCGHPVPDRAEYERLFDGAGGCRAVGEASTGYLYYEDSPDRIHALVPGCRIVAVLRNPVDRAFSGWCHEVREGLETVSFEQALDEEEQKGLRVIRGGDFSFNYIRQGFVAGNLARYIELFGRERVLILFYDDLERDPDAFMARLFRFLGVAPGFRGDWSYRYNPSGVPRFDWLHRLVDGEGRWRQPLVRLARWLLPEPVRIPLWHRVRDWNVRSGSSPALDPATRRRLQARFAGEIDAEEALTGRSLEPWRAGRPLDPEPWAGRPDDGPAQVASASSTGAGKGA